MSQLRFQSTTTARIAVEQRPRSEKSRYFYLGKRLEAVHFVDTALGRIRARVDTCLAGGEAAVKMPDSGF